MPSSTEKILVLGAASWLGYLLIEELSYIDGSYILAGTFNRQKVEFTKDVKTYYSTNLEKYKKIINEFEPTTIINFLRGEDEEGELICKFVSDYLKENGGYYVYASSVLALDGYNNIDLTEEILAKAKSDYGIFKAKAEQNLYDSSGKWCILRFSSVQGWVPHKLTRNEIFVKKLAENEKISVDLGVFQNRMLADLMIKGISKLINLKTEGIIHFGTLDNSDEIDFLREQAKIFGFSSNLIEASANKRNMNLVCVPNRIFNILGDDFKIRERDTLNSLSQMEALKKYKTL